MTRNFIQQHAWNQSSFLTQLSSLDYRYPYIPTWNTDGESGSSNLQSSGSRPPLVSLQHEPPAKDQQPEVAPQQPSSPTGNQFHASVGAPIVATVPSLNYEPNRFIMPYASSFDKPASAPQVPSLSAGYTSPPIGSRKTPSFPVQPQFGSGTLGNQNVGSYGVASSPFYQASFPPSEFAYLANTGGDKGTTSRFDSPAAYAPTASEFGDGTVSYGNPSSAGFPSWEQQPTGEGYGAYYYPSDWVPSSSFPDFSIWDSKAEEPQSTSETSPLAPSSYIIQSRNNYERSREVLSHTKYSPEYPQPPIFPSVPKPPSNFPPMTGSKGGQV